jgi:hypothetical protein
MTLRRIVALALIIAALTTLAGLIIAAWPATATLDPPVTPTTIGFPGPTGGPQQ